MLGALFKAIETPNVPMLKMSETRRAYGAKDMQDWCSWWDVKLKFPSVFPIRTVLPLRVAILSPSVRDTIYSAAWVDDQNVGDEEVLKNALNSAGWDGNELVESAKTSQFAKEKLRENTERAHKLGVCGVPTFQVDDGEIIWGQDRIDTVLDLLAGWNPEHSKL